MKRRYRFTEADFFRVAAAQLMYWPIKDHSKNILLIALGGGDEGHL